MHCQRVCKLQFKVTVEGAFLALTYVICLSSQLNAVYFQMVEGIAHVMQSLLLWKPLKTSSLLTFYCYARYYWYSWYSPFLVQCMLLQRIAYLQLKMVKKCCIFSLRVPNILRICPRPCVAVQQATMCSRSHILRDFKLMAIAQETDLVGILNYST